MSRPHAHMRYRRSVYRKRKIRIIVITTLCVIAALALLFIVIGNILGNKVAQRANDGSSKDKVTEVPHVTVKDVNAVSVLLEASGSTLDRRVSNAVSSGHTDLCFNIYGENGALLYVSPTAQALGKQADVTGLRTLDNIVKIFAENGAYSIAILDATELESDNDLTRSAAIGYYAALSAELLRAGVNEVLISVGSIPLEQYGELITLSSEIHSLSPTKGLVGVSLPSDVFAGEQNEALVASLWGAFDYLAVDLYSTLNYEGDIAGEIGAKLGSMLYHLLRYNVRALVPDVEDTALAASINETALSNGVKSIQIMP